MSTRTADPQATLADAGHDLLTALAQLVDRHPDLRVEPDAVGELLDELTALLRRTRGRVTRTRKTGPAAAVPAEVKPATPSAPAVVAESKPAEPTAPAAAVVTPPARVVPQVVPPLAVAPVPATPPAAAVASPARRAPRRWWVLFGAAVLLVVLLALLAGCGGDGSTDGALRRGERDLVVVALTSQRAQLLAQILDVPPGMPTGGDHRRGDQPGAPPAVQGRPTDAHSAGRLSGRDESITHEQDDCARLGSM